MRVIGERREPRRPGKSVSSGLEGNARRAIDIQEGEAMGDEAFKR